MLVFFLIVGSVTCVADTWGLYDLKKGGRSMPRGEEHLEGTERLEGTIVSLSYASAFFDCWECNVRC